MRPERPSCRCIAEEPSKGNFARAAGGNVAGVAHRGFVPDIVHAYVICSWGLALTTSNTYVQRSHSGLPLCGAWTVFRRVRKIAKSDC